MRMVQQHICQRAQLCLRIGRASRVGRRVQQQPFGFWRNGRFQRFRRQLVIHLRSARDSNRLAARQQNHVRIGDPIRGRDDHFITGIQCGEKRIVDDGLAAWCDVDLARLVGQAILAREFRADGFLQFRHAIGRRVFCLAIADRLDGRVLDIVGRIEIRLACAQTNHVMAFTFQLIGFRCNGNGG